MQVSVMFRRLALGRVCAVAGLWLMVTPAALAQDEESRVAQDVASAHVQALADSALEILRQDELSLGQREAVFHDLLREGFNLEAIGNLVLARNRLEASPIELEEYHRLFAVFVLARYSMLLGGYAGENFAVLDVRDSGQRDVLIMSRIDRPGRDPISAAWRVRAYEGAPKIIDVQVENISMVISQREEFNAVIQRGGFSALLESLRAQTEMLSVEAPS